VASHHLFPLPHRDKETFSEVNCLRHDFTTSSVVRQLGFNIQIDHEYGMLDVSRRVGVITLSPRKLTRLADRKVRCEMQKPSCSNCSRMGRSCPGYGLRLSWPKGKSRRAFFHDLPPRRDHVGEGASYVSLRFLNATLQDTWLSHELLASKTPQHTSGYTLGAGKHVGVSEWSRRGDGITPILPHISWNIVVEQDTHLLDYC
jgi:hypothetical protein